MPHIAVRCRPLAQKEESQGKEYALSCSQAGDAVRKCSTSMYVLHTVYVCTNGEIAVWNDGMRKGRRRWRVCAIQDRADSEWTADLHRMYCVFHAVLVNRVVTRLQKMHDTQST